MMRTVIQLYLDREQPLLLKRMAYVMAILQPCTIHDPRAEADHQRSGYTTTAVKGVYIDACNEHEHGPLMSVLQCTQAISSRSLDSAAIVLSHYWLGMTWARYYLVCRTYNTSRGGHNSQHLHYSLCTHLNACRSSSGDSTMWRDFEQRMYRWAIQKEAKRKNSFNVPRT